jgi:hypothetical protein
LNHLNLYYDPLQFKNRIQFLDKMLEVYAILNFSDANILPPSERKVLLYYIQKGISEETLETVCKDVGYKRNYLHTVNKKLRDKGYLVRDENNTHKFHLNSDLQHFRKRFVLDGSKAYFIEWKGAK